MNATPTLCNLCMHVGQLSDTRERRGGRAALLARTQTSTGSTSHIYISRDRAGRPTAHRSCSSNNTPISSEMVTAIAIVKRSRIISICENVTNLTQRHIQKESVPSILSNSQAISARNFSQPRDHSFVAGPCTLHCFLILR